MLVLNLDFRVNCNVRLITWLNVGDPKFFNASALIKPESDRALQQLWVKI